ncbi:MAG: AI-2E family transporter [Rikenellaceae bacterium]
MDNRVISSGLITNRIIGASIVAILLFLAWFFMDVVVYILISAVLAIMTKPLMNYLVGIKIKGWNIPRNLAAVITLFTIWITLLLLISLVLPLIVGKINQLSGLDFSAVIKSIEEPILTLQHHVQHLLSLPESDLSLSDALIKYAKDNASFSFLNNAVGSVVGLFASFVIAFFSVSFITFFFIKDDSLFMSMVVSLVPSRHAERAQRAFNSITLLLSRYFVGLLGESSMIAILISIAMMSFGMSVSDAIFMGFVMGVLNVIPYAGPFIGICFSLFLGVVTPIESMGIGYTLTVIVITCLTIKGLDDFMLQPLLYSERVKAHPLEIFIVILLSGYVAGVVGMLLAIPSYTVIRVVAKEFFSRFSLVRKLTREL